MLLLLVNSFYTFNENELNDSFLAGCAKYTGGSLYYYPGFNAALAEDALKFADDLHHLLTRPIGLEAVLRVRATKGIISFYLFVYLR